MRPYPLYTFPKLPPPSTLSVSVHGVPCHGPYLCNSALCTGCLDLPTHSLFVLTCSRPAESIDEGKRCWRKLWGASKSQVFSQHLLSKGKRSVIDGLAESHFDGAEVRINEIRWHNVVNHRACAGGVQPDMRTGFGGR